MTRCTIIVVDMSKQSTCIGDHLTCVTSMVPFVYRCNGWFVPCIVSEQVWNVTMNVPTDGRMVDVWVCIASPYMCTALTYHNSYVVSLFGDVIIGFRTCRLRSITGMKNTKRQWVDIHQLSSDSLRSFFPAIAWSCRTRFRCVCTCVVCHAWWSCDRTSENPDSNVNWSIHVITSPIVTTMCCFVFACTLLSCININQKKIRH